MMMVPGYGLRTLSETRRGFLEWHNFRALWEFYFKEDKLIPEEKSLSPFIEK
jgi:hypothetical protein